MEQAQHKDIVLVSACLVGLCTRYDATIKKSSACLNQLQDTSWLPVCPEQLGGLPTPRETAALVGGDGFDVLAGKAKVISRSGRDVTQAFISGARQCLAVVLAQNITTAFFKTRSPSCGLSSPTGVTAALLRQHGIRITEF